MKKTLKLDLLPDVYQTQKSFNSSDYNLRFLICALLELFYKDLLEYIKNPTLKEKEFYRYKYKIQYLIDFWENDAETFFSYLYGKSIAKKIINKVSRYIEQAKTIYEQKLYLLKHTNN